MTGLASFDSLIALLLGLNGGGRQPDSTLSLLSSNFDHFVLQLDFIFTGNFARPPKKWKFDNIPSCVVVTQSQVSLALENVLAQLKTFFHSSWQIQS